VLLSRRESLAVSESPTGNVFGVLLELSKGAHQRYSVAAFTGYLHLLSGHQLRRSCFALSLSAFEQVAMEDRRLVGASLLGMSSTIPSISHFRLN